MKGRDSRQLSRRVLFVATTVQALDHFIRPQIPAYIAAGWQVGLVSSPGAWAVARPESPVWHRQISMNRAISPLADSIAMLRLTRLFRIAKPDLVVGCTPKAGLLSMMAARAAGVQSRVFLHWGARWETESGLKRQLLIGADRLTALSATHVVAVSPSLADLLVSERVVDSRPTVLGFGGSTGVDQSLFHRRAGTQAADADGSRQTSTVGFVGRITRDKGVSDLLQVFDSLRAQDPSIRLLVAGPIDDSDPVDSDVLSRLAADPLVTWVGETRDVPSIMRSIDLLAFPSLREGLPNVVLEAAASGVPVVAWDVTGVRDAVLSGSTGQLVPPGDRAAFAEACWTVLNRGREFYESACLEWAENFEQSKVTALHLQYFGAITELM